MTNTIIRDIAAKDHPHWMILWAEYLRFYREKLPVEITDATWAVLMETDGAIKGIVAEKSGIVVGFALYLFHPSTGSLHCNCYLEDLYVAENSRGGGVARALILEVYKRADIAKAGRVYWQTQQYNAPARALYDTLAKVTSNVQYERY